MKEDVKIAGANVFGGGEFRNVKISGAGKVTNDLSAEEISVSGAFKALGEVTAKQIKLSGSAHFEKNVKSEYFAVSGGVKILGNLNSETLKVAGEINCKGEVNSDEINIESTDSKLSTVYGENIFIGTKSYFGRRKSRKNQVQLIEATTVEVNQSEVDIIRGSKITVGANSVIKLVEYSDELILEDNAVVKESIKV